MKKLIAIVAVAASVMATPAFAQSFDPDAGTGNVLSFSSEPTAQHNNKIAGRQSGLNAYAMVPGTSRSASDSNNPAATGGGSEGYNQLVETY
jgi:opacity protein-like surface antigen